VTYWSKAHWGPETPKTWASLLLADPYPTAFHKFVATGTWWLTGAETGPSTFAIHHLNNQVKEKEAGITSSLQRSLWYWRLWRKSTSSPAFNQRAITSGVRCRDVWSRRLQARMAMSVVPDIRSAEYDQLKLASNVCLSKAAVKMLLIHIANFLTKIRWKVSSYMLNNDQIQEKTFFPCNQIFLIAYFSIWFPKESWDHTFEEGRLFISGIFLLWMC
jgi:hypothetical protein